MHKKRKRTGITIAEMCVVLAVLAIVGTVVVSFSVMVNARSAAATTKLSASEDRELCQVILKSWVDRMTGLDASITADETGLSATVEGQAYRVAWEEGTLTAPLPDGQKLFCPIDTVEELQFRQMTRSNGNPLIFCTLVYSVTNAAGNRVALEDTFTILSRVGERVGETASE